MSSAARGRAAPDRNVLITGASSGIGRATAHALAKEGGRLMLAARGIEALERTAAECRALGADAVAVTSIDLSEPDSGAQAVEAALARLGRLDVVVHSAAVTAYGRVDALPVEVFERVIDVNLHGTARIARAALPLFNAQGSGTLVIVNSLLGRITTPTMGAYVTSKWAQRGLARVLQQEVRQMPGVDVCIVAPGSTNTPIYRQAANIAGRSPRPPVPVDSPERMAAAILRTIRRPKRMRSVGLANWAMEAGFAALPPAYDLLVGPMVQRLALRTGAGRAHRRECLRVAAGREPAAWHVDAGPMTAVVQREIAASSSAVQAVLSDGWLWAGWVVGATHIRDVDKAWPAVGAKLHHRVGVWPATISDHTEVKVFEGERQLVLRVRAWPVGEGEVRLDLTRTADGTLVVMREKPTSGPARLLPGALVNWLLRARNRESLARLASIAEHR